MPKCMRSGCIKVAIRKENLVCDKCRNRPTHQPTSQQVIDDSGASPFHTFGTETGRVSSLSSNMEESPKMEPGDGNFGGGGASGSWDNDSSSSSSDSGSSSSSD